MKKLPYCLWGLLLTGCKQAYDSPVKSIATGYLVVEGVVNNRGTTTITLTRTTPLDKRTVFYETGAKVKLEGENNNIYTFADKGSGVYSTDSLNLNTAIRYRLRITAKTGKEYLSDFVPVKNNPPIDSISWKRENGNGVQLYINTHDPQNNTRYYQWVYDETWQIQSIFYASLKYKIDTPPLPKKLMYSVVYRDSATFNFDKTIINCWQFYSSQSISLGSSVKLDQDVIYLPVAFVPRASIKLSVLYSIHIKQYTWTKEGYEFLDQMRKNTETTGSIFDAQPSELKSNIRCVTDSTEPVIGYFNICPVQEKRIFIKAEEVPFWGYSQGCDNPIIIANQSDIIAAEGLGFLPTTPETVATSGQIVTFFAALPDCVDCTLRGTNKKPAYWP